jgi:phosphotransferase system  glucose/maltose/N-acetylglucosamine-specific IIC component
MWAALYTMVLSAVAGILITNIWPIFIGGLTFIFKFIASDITNPMNLCVYGISDRFLAGLGLSQLIRVPFWFSSLGGSWVDITGTSIVGDVSIWTQQITEGLTTIGFGRLFTPYYVMNLFAIPAFILGIFQTFTDKFERRKFRGFFAVTILLAITVGMLFPFEMFLLFLTPLIYVIHIFISGVLFAVFQAMNVSLGYTFSGLNIVATPTSVADIILFARNPNLQASIMSILVVGVITAVVYFLLARVYFNYLAYDMMNTGKKNETVDELFTVFGGIDNIRIVHSSLYRVTVLPIKKNRVDFSLSPLDDVTKISESRAGYSLTFGAGSYIIRTAMIKRIKDHQKELLEVKKAKNKLENV